MDRWLGAKIKLAFAIAHERIYIAMARTAGTGRSVAGLSYKQGIGLQGRRQAIQAPVLLLCVIQRPYPPPRAAILFSWQHSSFRGSISSDVRHAQPNVLTTVF